MTVTSPLEGRLTAFNRQSAVEEGNGTGRQAVAAVPLPGLVTETWALRATLVPNAELVVEAVSAVVVAALLTV